MIFEDQNEDLSSRPTSPSLEPFYPRLDNDDIPLIPKERLEDAQYLTEPWADGLRWRSIPTQSSASPLFSVDEWSFSWPSSRFQEDWQDKPLLEEMGNDLGLRRPPPRKGNEDGRPGDRSDKSKLADRGYKTSKRGDTNHGYPLLDSISLGVPPVLLRAHEQAMMDRLPRQARKPRARKVLPMVFRKDGELLSISACPDSGSDGNIISLSTAQRLGCFIEPSKTNMSSFHLANSQSVSSVGRVVVDCSFGAGTPWTTPIMTCVFHVFATLSVPLIMGLDFLEITETYTKYKDRLVEEIPRATQMINVNSFGKPRKSLICQVGSHLSLANADTGSDIDLISEEYAKIYGFDIEEAYHKIMLADGRIVVACGIIRNRFRVGLFSEDLGFTGKSEEITLDFFVLPGLAYDVLIGQDTIHELDIFSAHSECFITSMDQSGDPNVNIIRYIGKTERALKSAWSMMGGSRGSRHQNDVEVERQTELDDQRENARREARGTEISKLYGEEKEVAQDEEVERIRQYEAKKGKRRMQDQSSFIYDTAALSPLDSRVASPWSNSGLDGESVDNNNNIGTANHVCQYPGCKAPAFQTQYLLNAHQNVHSSARPHYCPVTGCPRAEGGKGFKRKNEMIRHGLIHDSPGYVCPFCPDRDHRYPRPDNLQRHVRVHHPDVPKDDPSLRNVLAQRTDSPSRNRRHREMLI